MCSSLRLYAVLALAALSACEAAQHMKLVHGWKGIEYTFPDDATRQSMIDDQRYIPGNSVPISLEVDVPTDRIFISMPRFRPGNAATLATVSSRKGSNGEHLLSPYPDWRWHRQGDCEGITSVFRVLIDECRRLWIVDTGTVGGSVDVSVGVNRICPAQLLVFDLDTNKLIKRHEFPTNIIKPETVLTTIAVEVRDTAHKCRNTFAYVADVSGFGVLVYDNQHEESWRVSANEMFPYPPFGLFDIAGSQFDLMDGVLALALSPKEGNKERTLYFHSLAGDKESYVSTAVLRNKTNFENGANLVPRKFVTLPGASEGQVATMSMDDNGVLFFSVLPKLTINCWNTASKEYNKNTIIQVDHDPEAFQFISGVKVAKNKQGVSELWTLSSRFQRHMLGGVDPKDVNYRVMKAPIESLTRGTPCHVNRKPGSGSGSGSGSTGGGRPGGSGGGGGGGTYGGSGGSGGSGGNRPSGGLTFPDNAGSSRPQGGNKPGGTYSGSG